MCASKAEEREEKVTRERERVGKRTGGRRVGGVSRKERLCIQACSP